MSNLSLSELAARIERDAREIARLTTTPIAQRTATTIALEAQHLASIDLDTPPCGCWVCQGRPQDAAVEDACEDAYEDAAFALRMPGSRPDYEPSSDEVLEQLTRDATNGFVPVVR